jgi:hypothetical protein
VLSLRDKENLNLITHTKRYRTEILNWIEEDKAVFPFNEYELLIDNKFTGKNLKLAIEKAVKRDKKTINTNI